MLVTTTPNRKMEAEATPQPCISPISLTCTLSPPIFEAEQPHLRRQVEQFIRACFFKQYDARIDYFAELLLALTDHSHKIIAALGYQSAAKTNLFVEQYLDSPVEDVLQTHFASSTYAKHIERAEILEIGNLASESPGSTRRLILTLSRHFYQAGFRWLVVTMTPRVCNSFQKLGIEKHLMPLAQARAERLQHNTANWGTYYHDNPIVYGCCIESVLTTLRNRTQKYAQDQKLEGQLDNSIADKITEKIRDRLKGGNPSSLQPLLTFRC